jgi:hypothetical protein
LGGITPRHVEESSKILADVKQPAVDQNGSVFARTSWLGP